MKPPQPGKDTPTKTSIQEMNGQLYKVTEYGPQRKLIEPLHDEPTRARIEARKRQMGRSKKKTGG